MPDMPAHPEQDGRLIDANLHLLDRAVLDRDGWPVLAVADVEIEVPEGGGRPVVASLLLGSGLATRFFGIHRPRRSRYGVAWSRVTRLGSGISLSASRDELGVLWFERWLRDRVVGRIPGGRHDPR